MPRLLMLAATALFVVCSAWTVLLVVPIVSQDISEFWRRSDLAEVSRAFAALLLGLAVSSGVLFLHHSRQESYATFAEIAFLACFGISACNLLWLIPVVLFS
jgi:hypothetical protein